MIVFFFIGMIVILGSFWFTANFSHRTLYEIIYFFRSPMSGMDLSLAKSFLFKCLLPALGLTVILAVLYYRSGKLKKHLRTGGAALTAMMLVFSYIVLDGSLGITAYMTQSSSDFIEENYIPPQDVKITFPEKKQNLIFIYLESMETTFAAREKGGALDTSLIPGLTAYALENECFSGNDTLNGGVSLPATTWTMGAMTAMTSGLPLKIPVYNNYMDTQGEFFPGITSLGQILEENGYTNYLMVGSDADFGGRRLYFGTHGNYRVFDFDLALEKGLVDEKVFWGFEDYKLYGFAKEEITKLYEEGKPFNFTMLTVDTHFENGYVCKYCEDRFEDSYANVYACADRQICDFLEWLEEQPFYEDTTVIITGDHPTMDKDFCESITDYERKTYTCIISPRRKRETAGRRYFSTLDMFPTTLSALGADIEGNRLGLGTDLFSDTPTLLEEYGRQYLTEEFEKNSDFMESLNSYTINEELAQRLKEENGIECFETEEGLKPVYALRFDVSGMKDFDRLEAEVTCGGITETVILDDFYADSLNYTTETRVFRGRSKSEARVQVYLYTKDGKRFLVGDSEDHVQNEETDNHA